jgi:hypothetical protein
MTLMLSTHLRIHAKLARLTSSAQQVESRDLAKQENTPKQTVHVMSAQQEKNALLIHLQISVQLKLILMMIAVSLMASMLRQMLEILKRTAAPVVTIAQVVLQASAEITNIHSGGQKTNARLRIISGQEISEVITVLEVPPHNHQQKSIIGVYLVMLVLVSIVRLHVKTLQLLGTKIMDVLHVK